MEATVGVAAPVPSSAQTPTQENIPTQKSLGRVGSAPPVSNNQPQNFFQRTVTTTQHTPYTGRYAQAFWQKSDVIAQPSPQRTLPEVQDFLQKAYKTAQQSPQNAIAAAHLKAIAPVTPSSKISTAIVHDSMQKTWVTTQLPLQATISSVKAKETVSQPRKPEQLASEKLGTGVDAAVDKCTGQNETPSKVDQTGTYVRYNRTVQAEPHQGLGSPQKRIVLTAKRRQNPSLLKTEESSETSSSSERVIISNASKKPENIHSVQIPIALVSSPERSSEAQRVKISSVYEKPNTAHSSQMPIARSVSVSDKISQPTLSRSPFWNVFDKGQSSPTPTASASDKAKGENSVPIPIVRSMSVPEKIPLAPSSPQSSSAPSTSMADRTERSPNKKSVSSPKNSPIKQGTSRVAQTYHTYKASQGERSPSEPQRALQSLKKAVAPKQQVKSGPSQLPNGRRHFHKIQDDVDPRKRVLVSGFPPYTQPPDLTRVLTPFGNCQIDKCRNRLAVVTFDTEESAKSAIKASEEISIYGEFIEIKPFTTPRHVEDMFRAYKKVIATQKGQDVTPPNQIDLSGDFYKQMQNIQNAIRLTKEQVQAVSKLYVDLEMVLQQEWPGCIAVPFGSIPTGLGIKSSDADCFVQLPGEARGRGAGGEGFVLRARRLLASFPRVFAHLVAIPRANTPIVKFRHLPSGFHCDVSAKTPLGAQNSKLIKLLLEGDDRLSSVAVMIKYWARAHELSGTGRLTNYALVMMIVFYFQVANLLPPVEVLQRDEADALIVDHWNAGFASSLPARPADGRRAHELLGGFFQFYARFEFGRAVVCPYLGAAVPRALFAQPHLLGPRFERYVTNVREARASPMRHNTAFVVQDPFEQSHNVASSVSARLAADIRAYFKFAADAYEADRAAGCPAFLRTVLLTRPKIRRERLTPTTKIVLIPRVRGDFAEPSWRDRVREAVLDRIFDTILAIRLRREPDREEAERKLEEKREEVRLEDETGKHPRRVRPKIEREFYSGSTAKPVWRRKKNYSTGSPEPGDALVRRQRATTEEIISACSGEVRLRFDLELGFRDEPKHFYVFARLVEGEMETFSGFVTFMHTAMFDWFCVLVRPYLLQPREQRDRTARELAAAERAVARQACSIVFERAKDDGDADCDCDGDDDDDGDDDGDDDDDDPADVSRALDAVHLDPTEAR